MKNERLSNVLIRYTILLVVISITLLFCYFSMLSEDSIGILVLIIPFISALISCLLAVGKKQIVDSEGLGLKTIIANIIPVIIICFMLGFDVIFAYLVVYIPGLIFSYVYFKKKINRLEESNENQFNTNANNNTNVNDNISMNDNTIIGDNSNIVREINKTEFKKTTIPAFNHENIANLISQYGANPSNYFLAMSKVSLGSYALMGTLANAQLTNYIISFDSSKMYMFELSKISNKTFVGKTEVNISDISNIKSSNGLFGSKNITIVVGNIKKKFQVVRYIRTLPNHWNSVNNFINIKSN